MPTETVLRSSTAVNRQFSEHLDTTNIPQLVTSPTADRNLHGSSDNRSTQWIHYVVKTTQPRGALIVYGDALMTATTAYGYATRT